MRVFLAFFLSSVVSAQQPWPLIQIPGYNVFCQKPRLDPAGDSTICTVSTPFTAPNLDGIFYEPVTPFQFDSTDATASLQKKIISACSPGGLIDSSAQGNWSGLVGSDGYEIEGDDTKLPAYAVVNISNAQPFTWVASTTDGRALQKPSNTADRIAATWYSSSNFTIDIQVSDSATHSLSVYAVDWDCSGRLQQYSITGADGTVNTTQVPSFCGGYWQTWPISGHVTLTVTSLNAMPNAVVSGIFFDPLPAGSTGLTCTQTWADVCSNLSQVPQNCSVTCDAGVGPGALNCGPPLIQDANGIWSVKGTAATTP